MNDSAPQNIDFSQHYDTHIAPHIEAFETQRIEGLATIKSRKAMMSALWIFIICAFIAILKLTSFEIENWRTIIFISMFLLATTFLYVNFPALDYKHSVKESIFPNIFSFFGDSYRYTPTTDISVERYEKSSIIPSHNRESSEDHIQGIYKDESLEIFESILAVKRNKSRHVVFSGIFVELSMNKKFLGHTILKKDAGKLGNWFTNKTSSLERAKLEDSRFEKQFEVYTNDQVEARFLLTPDIMERIVALSNLFGGSQIQASFYENKLLLMIPNKENMFEPQSIKVPATFKEDINTIMTEMNLIHGIIDTLKLSKN